jgi:hypothetical protein
VQEEAERQAKEAQRLQEEVALHSKRYSFRQGIFRVQPVHAFRKLL